MGEGDANEDAVDPNAKVEESSKSGP